MSSLTGGLQKDFYIRT